MNARFRVLPALVALVALQVGGVSDARAAGTVSGGPLVIHSSFNDVSAPLRTLTPAGRRPMRLTRSHLPISSPRAGTPEKSSPNSPSTPTPATVNNFDGVGQGFGGPNGTFSVTSAPPDSNGATGPNHFVETVNTDLAVFNKSGAAIYGPVPINTVWSGFGGACQADNDGDPTVLYDQLADRWLISQFAIHGADLMCVAVSTSGDPTGSYNRYSFPYTQLPDYPKLSIWPDGYYLTVNLFQGGSSFVGAGVAALDRSKMLAGQPATQQMFQTPSNVGSLLPSSVDGSRPPPAGAPNQLLALGGDSASLLSWKFHVDWTAPTNSTFTGPTTIPVTPYAPACGGGTCIPQAGTSQQLDSLADRLMYRLSYRNLGDHESLLVDHSVTAGSSTGIRWYELRLASGSPVLYQQGTYAPDSDFRWMGSAALDQAGDMAVGYSKSSATTHPSIAYAGRLAGDPAGQLATGEGVVIVGAGSQIGGLSRWGDYSSMSIDPADDCTFWYVNEYLPADGSFNWRTRIASFKFPGCGAPPGDDFSISASPASLSLLQGNSGTSTISTAVTSGNAQSVSLAAAGLPAGATATFSPASMTAGGSSTMTVATAGATPIGTYSITVTGTGVSATHSTAVALTVTGTTVIVNGGFETGDYTGWTRAGTTSIAGVFHSGALSAMVGGSSPTNGDSSIAQSFVAPAAGGTLSFFYNLKCPDSIYFDWATATLRDNTAGSTATLLPHVCSNNNRWVQVSSSLVGTHSYSLTLVSHDDNYPGDATYTLYDDVAVSAPASGDFSISLNPSSLTLQAGSSATSTVSTLLSSGSAQTISLAATGLPAGASAAFNPASVNSGSSSTLTVSTTTSTPPGSYSVTVTGTGTSATHSTTLGLTVSAPPPPDFSISANPASVSVQQGASATSVISTAVTAGGSQSITLSAIGLPADATASFNPATTNAGSSSTLTLAAAATTPVGSYTVTVTGTGTSATHSTSVSMTVTAPPPPDFSISASPASLSLSQGASGTSTISTAVTSGAAQSVSLSASGLPAAASATFSPATITAGGSSTLTLGTAAATPAGSYTIAVTGTGSSATHSTSLTLTVTVPSSNPIVNGGFETGDFSGWTRAGTTSISGVAHSGTHSAMLGAAAATNGDSSISQAFSAPAAGGVLTFFYNLRCPDTVSYDWATATLRDSTTGTTSTLLPHVCANNSGWTAISASLTGGDTYTLTLVSHDDGFAGDPTYTLFDDVAIGPPPPPSLPGITNGDFETGNLSGWSTSGSTSISSAAHGGGFSGVAGAASATNGDSTISQTFTPGAGASQVSVWYSNVCHDTVTFDWVKVTLTDNSATSTTVLVPNTCSSSTAWTMASGPVVPGHSYTLTLLNHDDNLAGDPTFTRFDDITLT